MPHPQPPIARRDAGRDPYAWLEERDAPEVLDYLKAENAYLDSELADQAGLRETLFEEIRTHPRDRPVVAQSLGSVAVLPAHHRRR